MSAPVVFGFSSVMDHRGVVHDYKRVVLTKTSTSPQYPDSRVDSCLVVGLCVEQALKLSFSPAAGKLPVLLERQRPEHHQSVQVNGVRIRGVRSEFTAKVKVLRECRVRVPRLLLISVLSSSLQPQILVVSVWPGSLPRDS